jgi:DNA-binding CsgD family transcriptional regulator
MSDADSPPGGFERVRALLGSLPVLVTTRDREGRYTGVFSGQQLFGHPSPGHLVGRRTDDVLGRPAAEAVMSGVRTAIETGEDQVAEFPVVIGGERFWRGARIAPFDPPDRDGSREAIVVSFDLSKQHAREQVLSDALEVLGTRTSRSALERGFCGRLVGRDRYGMAWIGETGPDGPVVRATAGADGYLDALRDACGGLGVTDDPGVRSLRTGTLETGLVSGGGDWTGAAAAHGADAAVGIPLERNGVSHGVLAVYLTDAAYLVPWRQEVLELYADAVGYGLGAAMRRWALVSDRPVTLSLEITDGMVLLELCARAGFGSACRVASVVPRDGATLYYLVPPEGATTDLAAVARGVDGMWPLGAGVGDGIDRRDSEGVDGAAGGTGTAERPEALCGVVVDAETPESALADLGVNFERFSVSPSGATITATLPRAEDVRRAVELVREAYPETRLSVRWGDAAPERGAGDGRHPMGGLTDRQREALVTAYRHGYFDRDREHNATEIADRLGISRWTFSEHLRVAQGKLLERLLD